MELTVVEVKARLNMKISMSHVRLPWRHLKLDFESRTLGPARISLILLQLRARLTLTALLHRHILQSLRHRWQVLLQLTNSNRQQSLARWRGGT